MKSKVIGVLVSLFMCVFCFLIFQEIRSKDIHIDVEDLPSFTEPAELSTDVKRYDEERLIKMQRRFSHLNEPSTKSATTAYAAEIHSTELQHEESTYHVAYLEYVEEIEVTYVEDTTEYEYLEEETYLEEDSESEESTYYSYTYSPEYFKEAGRISWGDWSWTWYSERVLPGHGLRIPGRYTDELGYVRDEDGYLCLASDVLDKGTIVDTPFGSPGKVYDCGCGNNYTMDVYVGW